MRARLLTVAVGVSCWLWAVPVAAADDPTPPVIRSPECGGGRIIPDPRQGCAPETPGDPGGWQQLTLLAVLLVALVVIGLLVRRQIVNAGRLRTIDVDEGRD